MKSKNIKTAQPQKLSNIQYLRAFAAINVVLFHIIGYTNEHIKYSTLFFSSLTGWGQNGVDIFFVISGFIMIYIQNKKRRSPSSFLFERIRRIVPIYWLLNAILMFIVLAIPSAFYTIKFDSLWIFSSFGFVSRYLGFVHPFLLPGWTLELEMLFYMLFFISLFFVNKKIQIISVSFLILFVSWLLDTSILIEFILGIVIGLLYISINPIPKIANFIFLIGLILLLASINSSELAVANRLFYWGLPSALILFGLLYMKEPKNSFFELLGDASYSIYLIQVFTIPIFFRICDKFYKVGMSTSSINDLIVILCLIFTICVSLLFYKFVEKPIFNILKKYT